MVSDKKPNHDDKYGKLLFKKYMNPGYQQLDPSLIILEWRSMLNLF